MATLHRIINQSGTRLWAPQSEPTMPNPELGFKSVESRPARELVVDMDVVGGGTGTWGSSSAALFRI